MMLRSFAILNRVVHSIVQPDALCPTSSSHSVLSDWREKSQPVEGAQPSWQQQQHGGQHENRLWMFWIVSTQVCEFNRLGQTVLSRYPTQLFLPSMQERCWMRLVLLLCVNYLPIDYLLMLVITVMNHKKLYITWYLLHTCKVLKMTISEI